MNGNLQIGGQQGVTNVGYCIMDHKPVRIFTDGGIARKILKTIRSEDVITVRVHFDTKTIDFFQNGQKEATVALHLQEDKVFPAVTFGERTSVILVEDPKMEPPPKKKRLQVTRRHQGPPQMIFHSKTEKGFLVGVDKDIYYDGEVIHGYVECQNSKLVTGEVEDVLLSFVVYEQYNYRFGGFTCGQQTILHEEKEVLLTRPNKKKQVLSLFDLCVPTVLQKYGHSLLSLPIHPELLQKLYMVFVCFHERFLPSLQQDRLLGILHLRFHLDFHHHLLLNGSTSVCQHSSLMLLSCIALECRRR